MVDWRSLWGKREVFTRKTKIAGEVDSEVSTRRGEVEAAVQSSLPSSPRCHAATNSVKQSQTECWFLMSWLAVWYHLRSEVDEGVENDLVGF